ncbi:MAG TPA: hypothetical protein VMG08_06985 [Allosphingosinicella sp.]|nr:hypothetical protein [Allosphingosinicella sp.]
MNGGIAIFVLLMTAIGVVGWLINNWIRAKHGIPTDEELALLAAQGGPEQARQVHLLADQNEALRQQVGRLEERIAVLERIATDPAERTAREIERLRHG